MQERKQIINHNEDNFFYSIHSCDEICCIYLIESPSGKKYVGQTYNLKWRLYRYNKLRCDKQPKLYNSLKKYGLSQHRVWILEECDKSQLDRLEVEYISEYNTFNSESGLNLVSGGSRPKYSDETKEKLRKAATGKKYSDETNYKKGASLRGKNISEEVKLKMSIGQKRNMTEELRQKRREAVSGEKNPMYGIRWTEEQKKAHGDKVRGERHPRFGTKRTDEEKAKQSLAMKGRPSPRKGAVLSEETKEKLRLANTGKKYYGRNIANVRRKELHPMWGRGTPVIQYTITGEYVAEFDTANNAVRSLGREKGGHNILKCCNKKTPTAYGFKWEHKHK